MLTYEVLGRVEWIVEIAARQSSGEGCFSGFSKLTEGNALKDEAVVSARRRDRVEPLVSHCRSDRRRRVGDELAVWVPFILTTAPSTGCPGYQRCGR